jgi:hypothetical protein
MIGNCGDRKKGAPVSSRDLFDVASDKDYDLGFNACLDAVYSIIGDLAQTADRDGDYPSAHALRALSHVLSDEVKS